MIQTRCPLLGCETKDRRTPRCRGRVLALSLLLVFLGGVSLHAQTDLFTSVGEDTTGGDPPPGFIAIYDVTVAVEALATSPSQLRIELPGLPDVFSDLNLFTPRIGFDGDGNPNPEEALSFLWRGRSSEGFDVVLTVYEGQLAGQIVGPDGNYSISRVGKGFSLFHLDEPPVEEEPPIEASASIWGDSTPLEVLDRYADRIDPKVYAALKMGSPLPERIYLDSFEVFTEQARIDAGGHPEVTIDDVDIRVKILNGVDCTNAAFDNSFVNVEIRIVQFTRLTSFTPTGLSFADLEDLKNNATIQLLREATNADIVSVTIRSTGPLVVNCGYAYVQRPGCGDSAPILGCGMGASFRSFAIAWQAQNCIQYLSKSHETGHLLGCEHDPEHLIGLITPEQASRPMSFGHSVSDLFRTVMAIVSPPRILYFSSPLVFVDGFPTGIAGERHNARTIEILVAVMASFNLPQPSYISGDGFEFGDLYNWTAVVP
jgi:hypothetical protein